MQTILVTGSSGFVGSHFAKFFAKNGFRVLGLDEVAPPTGVQPYLAEHLVTDIADQAQVSSLCRKENVSGVLHCAAKCLVGESVEKPDLYWDYNVERGRALVETICGLGIRAFLFSSTAAVYGEPQETPIPETHPRNPINPYGQTKVAFEDFLFQTSESGRMDLGIFRYFNAAGADPEGELGENHDPETHLIPNAIRAALGQASSFSLFGHTYPTRDGTCERDYIHVWDLADAHLRLMRRLLSSRKGGIYNLGTGKGFTVAEVLDEIDRHTKAPVPRRMEDPRPGDPAVLVADSTRAQKDLRWTPTNSNLSKIILDALRWFQKTK